MVIQNQDVITVKRSIQGTNPLEIGEIWKYFGTRDKVKLQIFFGFPLGDLVGVDQTMASRVNNTSK